MFIKRKNFFLFLLFVFIYCNINCQFIEINQGDRVQITKDIYSYINADSLSLEEVIAKQKWVALNNEGVPNFGIINHNVFLKFQLKNNTKHEDLFLELAHPITDEVIFYNEELATEIQGSQFAFDTRKYEHTNFIFDLKLAPGSTKTYYLSVKNTTQLQTPLFVGTKNKLMQNDKRFNNLLSLFLGLMIAMVAYNLVLFFFVHDYSYLFYVLFISLLAITQLVPQGYAFHYFWPNSTYLSLYSMFFFPIAVGYAGIFFFNTFLKTKKYLPKIIVVLRVLFIFYFFGLILTLIKQFHLAYIVIDITALLVSLVMLTGAYIILKKGNKNALFFLIAWSVFLIGIVLWVLKDLGVIPYNFFTTNVMIIGAGIETILLSIGLANRINILTQEKDKARKNEIKLLKEKEDIVARQNELLEIKVKERTDELQKALVAVEKAQQKLIESEKMASIGQLTAGIAHEINNPINFVTSNIGALRKDFEDLNQLITAYEDINPKNVSEKLEDIEQLRNEIELDYLKTEIISLLDGIEEGAKRTVKIVNSLKVFTRSDIEEMVSASLSDGINSTLVLLQNKLEGITVQKDFSISEPVRCYSGKLNQVFMNVIANAVDAINERRSIEKFAPLITIRTYATESNYVVEIEDNGIGMDSKTKSRVFDPFFTTKEVGSGTGLGLSISYKFIKMHEGEINIQSQKGKGTTFTILIKRFDH